MDRPRKGRTGGRPQRGKTPEGAGFKLQRSAGTEKLRWPMRLNKYIAASGVCARRVAAELVKNGKVKVNGQTIVEPFQLVSETDVVEVNGRAVRPSENLVYILLNKPKNYLCTSADERGRHSVLELIREPGVERLFTVGRLDRNTTGLLLLTNDGEMAQRLSHPRNRVSKIYTVELNKPVSERDMQRIADGVMLEDGRAEVDALAWPDPSNRKEVILELHSGKNRIVRRIFESLGYEVFRLDRTGYAGLSKKDLPRGRYRHLADREVIMLRHFTGRVRNLDEQQDTGAPDRRPEQRERGSSQRSDRPARDSRPARPMESSRPDKPKFKSDAREAGRTGEARPMKPKAEVKVEHGITKAEPKSKTAEVENPLAQTAPAKAKTTAGKDSKPAKTKAEPKSKAKTQEKAAAEPKPAKAKTPAATVTPGKETTATESKAAPAKPKAEPKAKAVAQEKVAAEPKPAKAKADPDKVDKPAKTKSTAAKTTPAKETPATPSKTTKARVEPKTKALSQEMVAAEPKPAKTKSTAAKTTPAKEAPASESKAAKAKPATTAKAAVKEKAKTEPKTTKAAAKTKAGEALAEPLKPSRTSKTADPKSADAPKGTKATKASAKGKSDKPGN